MKNFRNIIDITPWDKTGGSFFGLKRQNARWLALVFILLGLNFLSPPFDPIPNDWMNMFLSAYMVTKFGWDMNLTLLASYIILGPALILTGIWIYPYNSTRLLNGYINKAKRFIIKHSKNPASIILGIIFFMIMYHFYKGWVL